MWTAPEKFYISRDEFVSKMSEYPLSHFLSTATFRKMIALRMPDRADAIVKQRKKIANAVGNTSRIY